MSPMFAQMFPGMEWMPLMLLGLVCGLSAGALGTAVGLAVSKSRFAFWAGIAACASGACSPVFFFLVAGRHLAPAAYPLLALPLLAGLPAILLSFRPQVLWLGEVGQHLAESSSLDDQKLWFGMRMGRISLALCCAAFTLNLLWASWLKPRLDFERLLEGEKQV